MPDICLPDGSIRSYESPLSGLELAADIGKKLARDAVAIKVDGRLRDLTTQLSVDCKVEIITRTEPEGLEILRHDAAHVMAEAVKELYPEAQITIGPAIENGFYYDISRDDPFHPEDLERLESRMRDIVDRDENVQREVWDRERAIEFFRGLGETYKAEIIEDLPPDEIVTVYRQGDFVDLCRGPHLPSTGRLGKAFKLLRISGAYWRGNSDNEMLQRIYGTAWSDERQLKAYLHQLEEAEKRDHRRLAKEMDLFHFQDEGPGCVFWHPKGWTLFQTLIDYMRKRQQRAGYLEIATPEILDRSLWEASGHWDKFGDNMFTTQTPDDRVFALKPMNCPGGVQVYKQGIKSYRDLPLRMSEFGKVHRFEPSGALHGLMRVRAFTQDDAHIFCSEAQITEECVEVTDLVLSIYRDFGFHDIAIKFADRPDKRVGSDEIWDKSEAALKVAVEATGLPYTSNPGEGAFYGPKLEFVLRDAIGRDWQCGTVQVDLNLPQRLGAFYVDERGERRPPVMIHRALFGSLERFTGILLEHYAGRLPLWLSPVQAVVATITSDADRYAREVANALQTRGVSVETDLRNEKISYKVREHSHAKVPVILVVGSREEEQRGVSMRRIGSKQQDSLTLHDAAAMLAEEVRLPTVDRAPVTEPSKEAVPV